MPKIKFMPHEELCPEGVTVEANEGDTICDVALRNNIDISISFSSDTNYS